ncbi:MAG: M23 family metallopeptidase, partial [Rikenellaceae bacterium]
PTLSESKRPRKIILSIVVPIFGWCGVALLYYAIFSIFFDTPLEYEIRKNNSSLKAQYEQLSATLDTLEQVLVNLSERDENVYQLLFESKPSDIELFEQSATHVGSIQYNQFDDAELAELFFTKLGSVDSQISRGTNEFISNERRMTQMGDSILMIPSIQPVVNNELTKLAASFGFRIQPFVKNISFHQGVDFAVAEQTRVFATANGKVTSVRQGENGEGLTIDINHGNGYVTSYSHLSKSLVWRGNSVKWGQIIAYSGNSGLSYLPHLHYSVAYDGVKIDPLNYFFYELDVYQTQKMNALAQVAVQSLD